MTEELDAARKELDRAARRLDRIATLPQNKGDQVEWVHNGCVWTRVGDDKWEAEGGNPFPSSHVAVFDYVRLSRPTPEPTEKETQEEQEEQQEQQELGSLPAPEVTPIMLATFKAAWGAADAIGAQGRRVEAGLRAVLLLLQDQQEREQAAVPEKEWSRPPTTTITVPVNEVLIGDILNYTLDSAKVADVRRGQSQAEIRLEGRPGWSVYPYSAKVRVTREVY